MGDNWSTLAKQFAVKGFSVYLVDLRNHGRSPHADDFSYSLMADDLLTLFERERIHMADIIGHSMGGKVAMQFALQQLAKVKKLVIADIAPRYYAPHHQTILAALNAVQPESLSSRKEAEEKLRTAIREESTIQFLLKNLHWNNQEKLAWRFNLPVLNKNIEEVGLAIQGEPAKELPALFLRGENSGYIRDEDREDIEKLFPKSQLVTIPSAGHWIHAENPSVFFETVLTFLDS